MTAALIIILLAAAALHVIWALGIHWPIRDEAELAKAVVGAKGIANMPPRWASALVALALIGALMLVVALAGLMPLPLSPPLILITGWLMVVVFALRGIVSYLPLWRRQMEPRFDRLNRRFYGPLCLIIAALTVLQI